MQFPGPNIRLSSLVARRFRAPASFAALELIPRGFAPKLDTVDSWLLGASDGDTTGWWGPLPRRVAALACQLLKRVNDRTPASPGQWAERFRLSSRHMHAGVGAVAIGAAELALWDLAGKRANAPVWALLPPADRSNAATVYATCFGWDMVDALAPSVVSAVRGQGWPLQKWRIRDRASSGTSSHLIVDAASGDPARVAFDLCGAWLVEDAIAICESLPAGLAWIEEPTPPWRLLDSRRLHMTSPHAAGEHCYSPQDAMLLQQANIDVWQPDAVFCGGFTSLIQIASAAEAAGKACAPHGGGFLPAVHAVAAGAPINYLEWHLTLEPMRQAHLAEPIVPIVGSLLRRPDRPGWAGSLFDEP